MSLLQHDILLRYSPRSLFTRTDRYNSNNRYSLNNWQKSCNNIPWIMSQRVNPAVRMCFSAMGMAGLTYVVLCKMMNDRIDEMSAKGIFVPMICEARARTGWRISMPWTTWRTCLKYHLCCILYWVINRDLYYFGAWTFVGLRAVHSLIHCTCNDVNHRFGVYWSSTSVLVGLWISFTYDLMTKMEGNK